MVTIAHGCQHDSIVRGQTSNNVCVYVCMKVYLVAFSKSSFVDVLVSLGVRAGVCSTLQGVVSVSGGCYRFPCRHNSVRIIHLYVEAMKMEWSVNVNSFVH
jgi:hypothetical protein